MISTAVCGFVLVVDGLPWGARPDGMVAAVTGSVLENKTRVKTD
jgi:hypothetical protein